MRRFALAVAVGLCGFPVSPAPAAGKPEPQPRDPLATVLLVPGSGFHGVGPRKPIRLSIGADHWRRWGYRTRVVRYAAGRRGLADVAAAIRTAKRARPRLPLCVYGESSGGTWALVAAAGDPDVDCLVVSASPTDQETWARSDRGGALRLATEVWPGYFGTAGEDADYEPYDVWLAFRPAIPVFLVYAQGDQAIPAQQGKIFATVPGDIRLRVLHEGRRMFVHNEVDRDELLRVRGEARTFVGLAAKRARPAP